MCVLSINTVFSLISLHTKGECPQFEKKNYIFDADEGEMRYKIVENSIIKKNNLENENKYKSWWTLYYLFDFVMFKVMLFLVLL